MANNLTPAQTINAVAPYQGAIEWIGQPANGVSQSTGSAWANVDFVLKYLNHNMREEMICFTLSGPDKVNELVKMPLGTQVKVWWRPTVRKWVDAQGQTKWFPQFSAFSVTVVQPEAQPTDPSAQPQQPVAPQYAQQYAPQAPAQPVYQQQVYQQAAPAPAPARPAVQPSPQPAPANSQEISDLPFN